MHRMGDSRFLHNWQLLRSVTQPTPEATEWRTDQVTWRRHRTSLLSPGYSAAFEVYLLECAEKGGRWSFMVVRESWWGPERMALRSQLWASHVSGSKLAVHRWLAGEVERIEREQTALDEAARGKVIL